MGNKPRIRFKGFNDDWEQCKLGDIATFSKGNGYSKSDLAPSGEPIILYGRLYTNYETTIRNVDTFVELKDKSVISQGGEVIVPASGETAEDISRASVVKNQGIIIGGDLNVIKVNHLLNPTFLALTISNGEQQKELSKRAQGKSVVHLHNSDLQEVNLTFPLLNEQKEISSLFEKMDSVITLHQCKLEKLKLTKKALLQKLFPKNGKHIPEIRFKGFTDAWEQCKLSDVADVRDGTHDSPKFYNDGFPLVTSKNLKGGSIDFSDCSFISEQDFNEINKRSKVDPGDILFGMIGTIGNPAIVEHTGFAIKNVALIKEGNIINNRFIYHLLSSEVFENYIARENAGGTQKFIALNQIRNFDFLAPALVEQNKIIELLDCISQNITLHQRKLERLQEVKKGLLQKMFV